MGDCSVSVGASIQHPTSHRRQRGGRRAEQAGRRCCVPPARGMLKLGPSRDQIAKASSSNATATRRLGGSSTASSSQPRRRLCTKACPAITILALRSCLSPRIGPRRAFNRPWSASTRLLAYWSVRCQAAGATSSSTPGYTGAWSVTTSTGGTLGRANGLLEEPTGGRCVAPPGDEHVDDLAELVDGAVHVPPLAGDLDVGLVDPPAGTDHVPARRCGVNQQRREALHPAVDADVVDLDAAFGEQLFDVAVGQPEAQRPAHRQHDDVGWEAEAREGGSRNGSNTRAADSHAGSLAGRRRSSRTQQRPSSSMLSGSRRPAARKALQASQVTVKPWGMGSPIRVSRTSGSRDRRREVGGPFQRSRSCRRRTGRMAEPSSSSTSSSVSSWSACSGGLA
jgi:hypothetical protein